MAGRKLKIAARASTLASLQVREVMSFFPGLEYSLIPLESYGDKHREISLMSKIPDDFFTRELDLILLSGRADLAVHSAKDLPDNLTEGLEIIALTSCLDKTDCLVSANNITLKKLPKGASVGTSSLDRQKQILNIRRDLKIISVRGTIEERLELVEKGKIDALIAATCALKRLKLTSRITGILPFETHPLQGNLAVVAKSSRADLKVLFSGVDERPRYGKVYLVGSGPGPAEFLTFKADDILRHSRSIYYDDLLDENILSRYPFAEKKYVGKRPGQHSFPQKKINEMLYEAAMAGKIVTRLKGGDPFIFGRGGEELAYLQARQVDVEIVPGISSFQAAAAVSGIPPTRRGWSNELTLLSGHNAKDEEKDETGTLIYFMGASSVKEIGASLIKKGWAAATPAALVYKAGGLDEQITITNLNSLRDKKQKSPLMIIIGKTAGLCKKRNRVLFTGLDPWSVLIQGRIAHYPLIRLLPLDFSIDINKYDGFVFTSRQAVKFFLARYALAPGKKIISLGPHTSGELTEAGYKADYESPVPDSDVLAELISKLSLRKILYPCSDISDNKIHRLPKVEAKVIYKTKARTQPRINLNKFSGAVFSSPSTVASFLKIYKRIPEHLVLYVYGRHTAAALRKKGYVRNLQTVPFSLPCAT